MADKDPDGFDNRPTSQLDLERRMERGNLPEDRFQDNTENDVLNPEVVVNPWHLEGNDTSAYRGVSPEYMNYSSEGDRPFDAEEGPEAEAQQRLETGVAGVRKFVAPDNEVNTSVGVGATETLNTAVSGEGYSAKLVDAEPDHFGPAVIMPQSDQSDATVTTTQPATVTSSDSQPSTTTEAKPSSAPKSPTTSRSNKSNS